MKLRKSIFCFPLVVTFFFSTLFESSAHADLNQRTPRSGFGWMYRGGWVYSGGRGAPELGAILGSYRGSESAGVIGLDLGITAFSNPELYVGGALAFIYMGSLMMGAGIRYRDGNVTSGLIHGGIGILQFIGSLGLLYHREDKLGLELKLTYLF